MGKSTGRNDGGFVLVWALLLMVVVLILGVSGIGTSIFESLMTANDALHKQSFFQADGGANVAAMLIEENVSCPIGFTANWDGNTTTLITPADRRILVAAGSLSLYQNLEPAAQPVPPLSDANRDAHYFYDASDPGGTKLPRTNIRTGGTAIVLAGGAANMLAGYEGIDKSKKSGTATNYHTFSQYINNRQSQSIVEIMWQHINGLQGACNF